MNILCCFKTVPDLDRVLARDWQAAAPLTTDLSYAGRTLGCYDEAALEAALRLRDSAEKQGVAVRLTAVTVSAVNDDYFYRWIFAAGADRVCAIPMEGGGVFAPGAVSSAIAFALAGEDFDAVFCGIRSADGGSGLTPYLLSKKLELPCLSNVTDVSAGADGLLVKRQRAGGMLTTLVTSPAVLAVGNSEHPYLRLPTVKKRLAAAERTVERLPLPSSNVPEMAELRRILPRQGDRSCVFIDGGDCEEKAAGLLRLYPEVRKP